MWIHLLPLGLIDGAGGGSAPADAGGGGWPRRWSVWPPRRRLTLKDWEELECVKDELSKKDIKAMEKAVDTAALAILKNTPTKATMVAEKTYVSIMTDKVLDEQVVCKVKEVMAERSMAKTIAKNLAHQLFQIAVEKRLRELEEEEELKLIQHLNGL